MKTVITCRDPDARSNGWKENAWDAHYSSEGVCDLPPPPDEKVPGDVSARGADSMAEYLVCKRRFVNTLDKLKNDWESLAERDALWAILTDNTKAGRKWDIAEFMATGEAEIATVMNYL